MRVLFITTAYPPNARDPRGIFIHDLATALVAEGAQVTVLAPGAPGALHNEVRDGVSVIRVRYWIGRWQALAVGVGGIIPNLRQRPWLVVQLPILILGLIWEAVRLGPFADVVHAHWVYPAGIAGLISSRIHGKPLLLTSHGGDLNVASRSTLLSAISGAVARRADMCLGVSHAMVDAFCRIGAAPNSIRFVPLGVKVTEPRPAEALGRMPELAQFRAFEGLRVVYAGSLIRRKSVETLIEAHRLLVESGVPVAVLVIGAGPEEGRLRAAASEGPPRTVYFAGEQPPELVTAFMALGDVFVLPSRSEGRGLVVIEAMTIGIPVVASDIPGPNELISPGINGLLFRAGDAESLAECLSRLATDPSRLTALSQGAREWAAEENLTVAASASRHMAVYYEALQMRIRQSVVHGAPPS